VGLVLLFQSLYYCDDMWGTSTIDLSQISLPFNLLFTHMSIKKDGMWVLSDKNLFSEEKEESIK